MIFTLSRRLRAWWPIQLPFEQNITHIQLDDQIEITASKPIRCAHCQTTVTSAAQVVEIDSFHQRTCANPAGVNFTILLFRQAHCHSYGEPTEEYTWFAGYAWQVALCRQCGIHLGWFYSAPQSPGFYGLIKDQLVLFGQ